MKQKLSKMITTPFTWVTKGVSGKTSWEWLELLIVPLFLAMGAFYLEARVESRQERIAAERYEQEVRIADERVKQETLDIYLEKMQALLLDKGLRGASENSEVRSVARAITTTAVKELDAERNSLLIDFLRESGLIGSESRNEEDKTKDIAILQGLNLSAADLTGANLLDANMRKANLTGANLLDANMARADLTGADFTGADLTGANLRDAYLHVSYWLEANLSGAQNLSADQLEDGFLCKTKIPKEFTVDPDDDCKILMSR